MFYKKSLSIFLIKFLNRQLSYLLILQYESRGIESIILIENGDPFYKFI